MSESVRWNSQSLDLWAGKYAQGKFVDLGGRKTHYIEKGEGEPLILLHGFFYDTFLWARKHRCAGAAFQGVCARPLGLRL